MNWHLTDIQESLSKLTRISKTDSTSEVSSRLAQYGANELVEHGGRKPLQILWEQLTATMVLILIAAAVVAGLLGDTKNTIAILAIVVAICFTWLHPGISRRESHCRTQENVRAERARTARWKITGNLRA